MYLLHFFRAFDLKAELISKHLKVVERKMILRKGKFFIPEQLLRSHISSHFSVFLILHVTDITVSTLKILDMILIAMTSTLIIQPIELSKEMVDVL